jgi:hypothetical protein
MNITCPCCHARFPLQAALEDGAARELLGILSSRPMHLSRPLASYLGLFRSASRALAWERALRLADEALALEPDGDLLGLALSETVEAIYAKREREPARPLTNHNYLRRVLETHRARRPAPRSAGSGQAPPKAEAPAPEPEPEHKGPLHPDVAPRVGALLSGAVRGTGRE